MRIYGTNPEENEMADVEPARYIHFAIKHIDDMNDWLKTTNEPHQAMLLHIDVLLMLVKKYPDMYSLIKKEKVLEWESTFNEWFARCGDKIPTKYRNGIEKNAKELFAELKEKWYDLPY